MSGLSDVELADALLDTDLSEAHLDVQSLAATYKARRKDEDRRAAVFARALLKRARSTGLDVDGAKALGDMTAAELKDEIDRRNVGRDDDAKLSKSGNKAELLAALEADDYTE